MGKVFSGYVEGPLLLALKDGFYGVNVFRLSAFWDLVVEE